MLFQPVNVEALHWPQNLQGKTELCCRYVGIPTWQINLSQSMAFWKRFVITGHPAFVVQTSEVFVTDVPQAGYRKCHSERVSMSIYIVYLTKLRIGVASSDWMVNE
jgi:hypothetical protein